MVSYASSAGKVLAGLLMLVMILAVREWKWKTKSCSD